MPASLNSKHYALLFFSLTCILACRPFTHDGTLRNKGTPGGEITAADTNRSFAEALALFRRIGANTNQLEAALQRIGSEKPLEGPTFWIKIINSRKHSDAQRTLAVIELFNRYVESGDSIGKLGTFKGLGKWFTEKTMIPADAFSQVPFERGLKESSFMFFPHFMKSQQFGVYFRLSKGGFYTRELLEWIHTGNTNIDVRILQIPVSRSAVIPTSMLESWRYALSK